MKLISFNILAQDLLELHPYLYKNHDRQALNWEKRKPLIIQEIMESKAQVRTNVFVKTNKSCLLLKILLFT